MLPKRLSKSKAILDILFFVGMHPREYWVTQPISRAQLGGVLSLKTKACFNVSGRFLQPSHIWKIDLVIFTLVRSAGGHTLFVTSQSQAEDGPQNVTNTVAIHSRQTLRHHTPNPPNQSRKACLNDQLSLEGESSEKSFSHEVVPRSNQGRFLSS
jgi:hypothetical protein